VYCCVGPNLDRGLLLPNNPRLFSFNNPKRCSYRVQQIKFLGHVVSKDGIKLGQKKVDGLMKLSEPKDKQTLRSSLSLTNY
jgi:hypothetical protein